MRRRITVLTVAAVVVSGALATVAGATGLRSPHEPTYRPVPADVKTAKSLLLRARDLTPGFRATPPVSGSDFRCASYDPDLSKLVTTGEAESRVYERTTARGYQSVATYSSVFRTVREANAYWRRGFNDKRNGACFTEVLKESFGRPGDSMGRRLEWIGGKPEIERLGGAGRRLALWTVAPVLVVDGQRFSVEVNVAGFTKGRTAVFVFIAAAGDSFPPTLVEKIFVGVTERLDALYPTGEKPLGLRG